MRCRLMALAIGVGLSCAPAFGLQASPGPVYDVYLKLAKNGGAYTISLQNTGAPIVGPAKVTINHGVPGGVKVTGGAGTGGSWAMSPGVLPVYGPANIVLTVTTAGGTIPTNGMIGTYTFQTAVEIQKTCAKVSTLAINNGVVPEPNQANNGDCAP